MERLSWKDHKGEIGRIVLIAKEQREREPSVFIRSGLTSPFRPFNIPPDPEGVSHERFNFLFPPSFRPHTAAVMTPAHSTSHAFTPFLTNGWQRSLRFLFSV